MPVNYNLNIYRGDSGYWTFKFWDDPKKSKPSNLTGATALCQIRNKIDGTVITTIQATIVPPNIVSCSLEPDGSSLIQANAVWDLQITYPTGDVQTPIGGTVITTLDVSDLSKP